MHEQHQADLERAAQAARDPRGLASLATALREVAELQPTDVAGLQALRNAPAQPVRLSYVHEGGRVSLYVRRSLGGPGDAGVQCASVELPDWLIDGGAHAPESVDEQARRDLAELVRGSFAVFEARLAEYFDFASGNDTLLAVDPSHARLAIRPATTPSPRLQPALPSHEPGYDPSGDPNQAGGARRNRGTGGTGVDGTRVRDEAAVPGEQADLAPLGGDARAIEGTLGQALAEGSPTDDAPPAASPGRLGH
jgi:hypothetical protein